MIRDFINVRKVKFLRKEKLAQFSKLRVTLVVSYVFLPQLAKILHLKKKLIKLLGGLLDITTNIYLKSCAYHPDSECCTFFHGNLSNPKSSEDTLIYLYVI